MRNHRRSSLNGLSDTSGFSLVELVTVVAVLGSLTTISLIGLDGNGGIVGALKSAEIDEAKALLNKAAAACLQNARIGGEDKDKIDDGIISNKRINTIGFEIDTDSNADKCSYFQIIPTDPDDNIRFPIGFSVTDGILTKFANPTSDNKGSISSCERWAGINCKQDECLKKLIEWKNEISEKKIACESKYEDWLNISKTTPYKYTRWNPNAEEGCPARPSKDCSESYRTDPTCTPNGCNRVVYGLDGEFVGFTQEDYDNALAAKYGKICANWVNQKR